jgi:hypothetical protein
MNRMISFLVAAALLACCLAAAPTPAGAYPCLPSGHVPDHLACFSVKDSLAPGSYTADLTTVLPGDSQNAASGCVIKVPPKLACIPDCKEGVTPPPPGITFVGAEQVTPFLCYKVKCRLTAGGVIPLADQFGTHTLQYKANKQLLCAPTCVPSSAAITVCDNPDCCSRLCCSGQCHPNGQCSPSGAFLDAPF